MLRATEKADKPGARPHEADAGKKALDPSAAARAMAAAPDRVAAAKLAADFAEVACKGLLAKGEGKGDRLQQSVPTLLSVAQRYQHAPVEQLPQLGKMYKQVLSSALLRPKVAGMGGPRRIHRAVRSATKFGV